MKNLVSAFVIALACAAARAGAPWPAVALPEDASRYDIGQQMTVNGMPLRMQGFLSPSKPDAVAAWLRRQGKPLVQDRIGAKLVLGRVEGEFYVTVQLEEAGSGTRGLVAVSHLKAGYEQYAAAREAAERLLQRLPAGSRLVSQMNSSDAGRVARHVVLANDQPVALNRDRLVALMREDGLQLQREARPVSGADGATLLFQGPAREANAIVSRGRDGVTTLVLHFSHSMETYR